VIVATERAKRPGDFPHAKANAPGAGCAFCEGNESQTPPEILAVRPDGGGPDGPGWQVRVIPSTHPVLDIEGEPDRAGDGMFDMMNDVGAHEVILETPEHVQNMADLDAEQIARVLSVYLDRVLALEKQRHVKYVLIYKNYGVAAGAGSFTHTHSQLIATPVNPKQVKRELLGARKYFDYKDRCIFCDIIREERADPSRVVLETDGFISVCPFASRFPYELCILPKRHSCDFETVTRPECAELAEVLKGSLGAIQRTLDDPPYNYVLHTAPFRKRPKPGYWKTVQEDYHWHIEIMPRLTQVAGFEWGSGFYINPVPPEQAAADLRNGGR
jgi:UDPglucose--hexose-1-phosphate uridylyltransferase